MNANLDYCCRIDDVRLQLDFIIQSCETIAKDEQTVEPYTVEGLGKLLRKIKDELKTITEDMDQ